MNEALIPSGELAVFHTKSRPMLMPEGLGPDALALWGAAMTSANREARAAVIFALTERDVLDWVTFTNRHSSQLQ